MAAPARRIRNQTIGVKIRVVKTNEKSGIGCHSPTKNEALAELSGHEDEHWGLHLAPTLKRLLEGRE
jgi:hypothetical protein